MSKENGAEKKARGPARGIVEKIADAHNALHPDHVCHKVAFEAAAPDSWRLTINDTTASESRPTPTEAGKDFLATTLAELYAQNEREKAAHAERSKRLRELAQGTRSFGDKHRGSLPGF